MQISIANLSEAFKYDRIDSDFFMPDYKDSNTLIDLKKTNPLSQIAYISDGNHLKIAEEFIEYPGVRYLRGQDLSTDMLLSDRNIVYISETLFQSLKRSHIYKDDILITIVGANTGLVGLVFSPPNKLVASCKLGIIRPQKNLFSGYLYAFLVSHYGQSQILRSIRGGGQTGLILLDLKQIQIVRHNEAFEGSIHKIVYRGHKIIDESRNIYCRAEQILLSELGLLNWKPKHRLSFIKNFSDTQSSDRIDAEYFQPMYEEIIEAVKKYKGGFVKLGEVAKTKRGSLISDTLYSENKGVPYIRGADFSSGFLGDDKLVYIDNSFKPSNETKIKKGDIVFTLIGTVGATALVDEKFDGAFISNNLGKISIKNYNSTVLQILLHSIIGKMYFQKEQTQTAQPKISDKDIHGFILPSLKDVVIEKIETQYLKSQKAKSLSKRLLDIAKRGVEMAIEKSEKDAQIWIEAELKKLNVHLD